MNVYPVLLPHETIALIKKSVNEKRHAERSRSIAVIANHSTMQDTLSSSRHYGATAAWDPYYTILQHQQYTA